MNIKAAQCSGCGIMGLKTDSMVDCLCCEASPRKQHYMTTHCSNVNCQKPILSKFNIEVGVETEEIYDPSPEIVINSVNMIIHAIIMLEGPLCEKHMSEKFGQFCSREYNSSSIFDLIYKSNEEIYMAKRLKLFQEEWA